MIRRPAALEGSLIGPCLPGGGVAALPTDAAHGLAVDATNPRPVEAPHALKGRDSDKPIAVLIESMTLFRNLTVRPPEDALKLAEGKL